MPKLTNAERAKNFRKRQKEKAKATGQQKNPARTSTERSREHRAREREKRPSIISTTRPKHPQNTPVSLEVNCSVEKMSSSESAEPAGWLRLGDLAIGGDGGVCVTSLIKDKIREYMLNEEQQQTTATSTTAVVAAATVANTAQASNSGDVTCVRQIGNSLDLLLRESRNAGHAVAAATVKNKTSSSSPPSFATAATMAVDVTSAGCAVITGPVDHIASTAVITAPADSSRPTVDRPLPPLPPLFTKRFTGERNSFSKIFSIARKKSFHSVRKMLNRSKPVSCKRGSLQNRLSNKLFIIA